MLVAALGSGLPPDCRRLMCGEPTGYKYSDYFLREVLRKRPYLKKEWCELVVEKPVRSEAQEDNRFRFWGRIPDLGDRYLRVITLGDKVTIHNAFPDRRFKP